MTAPVIVVGGGLAGGTVVAELRELGHDGPLTVICGETHPPYERPPLTKSYLRGESTSEDTYLHPTTWYAEHDVNLLVDTEVESVDLLDHRVGTSTGAFDYSKLVLATGSRARRLTLEPSPQLPVHYLRSLADAGDLRAALGPDTRLLVVGGGWIGLEVAASARAVGAAVTLVEPAPQPLASTLGVEIGGWFADLHRAHGVDLRTGTGMALLDGRQAVLDDGTRLEVDQVVVGIGAIPNDTLARNAGLEVDNGVHVDGSLVTSHPDVLAIGDIANHLHPMLGERIRVEHWQNALGQAKVAAQMLAGRDVVYDELPSFFSDQYDAGLQFFGHLGNAPADLSLEPADNGFIARWHRDGRLVAAAHVNQWATSEALSRDLANAY